MFPRLPRVLRARKHAMVPLNETPKKRRNFVGFCRSEIFGYIAGFMCDLCSFVNICMVWWRVTVRM